METNRVIMAKKKLVYNYDEQGLRTWSLDDDVLSTYVHPLTHPASMIEEDSTHRFVTDIEKITWNNNSSGGLTQSQILARNLGC